MNAVLIMVDVLTFVATMLVRMRATADWDTNLQLMAKTVLVRAAETLKIRSLFLH